MATKVSDDRSAGASRALPLRRRADLSVEKQSYQGRVYWVIKDPVALKYYRFQEEEYFILQALDGRISLDELQRRFERTYAPQKTSPGDLQHFIGRLHENGLIISSAAGQAKQLLKRGAERRRKAILAALTNVLAIRFKGIDPERLLSRLYPWAGWIFSFPAVVMAGLLALASLLLVTIEFDVLRARLPAFEEFFGPQNWLLLAATLAVTKILHELGHGLACKRFGGECHEIGFMLLVLTPCLYCNVTDAWMLRSKWRRAAIGAAGMYVELILASIATLIWSFTDPGLLNHLCLQVMFVCSVSTVLFNGNPLLRYDGYYILSDLAEIPNLSQKAAAIFHDFLGRWCLGIKPPERPFLPERRRALFGLYTVASIAYRWVVVVSVLWFLLKVFEPYGLQAIGYTIAAISVGSMIITPLWRLVAYLRTPGRMQQVCTRNVLVTLLVLAAVTAGVLLVPIPRYVHCSLEIRPRDAAAVYFTVPARLAEVFVAADQQVDEGTPLARLESLDLQIQIAELETQQAKFRLQLESLANRRFDDPMAGEQVREVEATLRSIDAQLVKKRAETERLEVRAPVAGTVLPAESLPEPKAGDDAPLPQWSGSLLDPKNLGAAVQASDLLCRIGDPQKLEAALVVDQGDVEQVAVGQAVELMVDAQAGGKRSGTIASVAEQRVDRAPASLTNQAGGGLSVRTDSQGIARPLHSSYYASVPLDNSDEDLKLGYRGQARIRVESVPLATIAWRWLARTFHFEL